MAALWVVSLVVAVLGGAAAGPGVRQDNVPNTRTGIVKLRALGASPASWDPARQGDVGSSATLAQVFEGLTAFDPDGRVQPALARSWSVEDEGRRIVFELRDGVRFSDDTPLTAKDVVASWLRLIDPQNRSPLASLLDDVEGARDYARGAIPANQVGLKAEGDRIEVRLRRPASYFVSVTASPSLAVVPAATGEELDVVQLPRRIAASGAYVPVAQGPEVIRLEANPEYWAGPPALDVIELVTDIGGRSPVDVFQDGDLDLTGVAPFDASWIRYDPTLGPQLREAVAFSVTYYGFDTTRPPFDDARVRRAFAEAADWGRLVQVADTGEEAADSLAPPGLAGRSENGFAPTYDPEAARRDLARAGYPGGRGFPVVSLVTGGTATDRAAIAEWEQVLGVQVAHEVMPFDELFNRLDEGEPPPIWSLSWIADYPHVHDFLGLLALSDSGNNYGGWSSAAYDAAIEEAAGDEDPEAQAAGYDRAQAILRDESPFIPLSYGRDWSLAAEGLLGANESGLGFLRFAGLDWAR
jgi:ABC-type transport system substrate-binding protein